MYDSLLFFIYIDNLINNKYMIYKELKQYNIYSEYMELKTSKKKNRKNDSVVHCDLYEISYLAPKSVNFVPIDV